MFGSKSYFSIEEYVTEIYIPSESLLLGKTIDEYNLVEEDASFYLKTGDVKPIWKHTKKKMKGMHGH